MRPLSALTAEQARGLVGLAIDLDDTVLDRGLLLEDAYSALFRLREAGLAAIVTTGRPASWGELLARQWPIAAAVTENGAIAFVREAAGVARVALDSQGDDPARRAELLELARALCRRHPPAALADDNAGRVTDVTIDVGEHRSVAPELVGLLRAEAEAAGARTTVSSVHLHLATSPHDKATGTLALLGAAFGEDATGARRRWGFVGDSGNDAAAFAAFALTFGPANVRDHARRLSVPPRFVADRPMGRGFAQIASVLASLRRDQPGDPGDRRDL